MEEKEDEEEEEEEETDEKAWVPFGVLCLKFLVRLGCGSEAICLKWYRSCTT